MLFVFASFFAVIPVIAEEPAAASEQTPSAGTAEPAAQEPKKKGPGAIQSAVSGFFDRFASPKEEENAAPDEPVSTTPLENVLPDDALMILRTSPIGRLNKSFGYLLGQVGLGELAPLDWLKISPYGKAVAAVDVKRPLGAVWHLEAESAAPIPILYVPIRSYGRFVESLGGKPDADGIQSIQKPRGWLCAERDGFALLTDGKNRVALERALGAKPFPENRLTPPALIEPDFSLEVTERGLPLLNRLGVSAAESFFPLLASAAGAMNQPSFQRRSLPERADRFLANFQNETGRNLRSIRVDGVIANNALLTAVSLGPRPGSELDRQVHDKGGAFIPTSLEVGFLKILPDVRSAFCGQTDISPDVAARFEAPFNRLRHVEYTFPLPNDGRLLAESWGFFLEVDDSDAFIRELIIPKAQLIGSHIGSERLGEIGAKILGNLATRRQARGRRPILGSPEEAAARGGEIGSKIGGEIGGALGEQMAMTMREFEGYPLLVSDLELYTKQMREINALASGEKTRPPIILDGEPTLRILLGQILSGLESGSLEGIIQNRLTSVAGNLTIEGETPLLAATNFFLILDSTHILVVPGDENMLRAAKNNWETRRRDPSASLGADGADWRPAWDLICDEMEDPRDQILRGASRFDAAEAQRLADFVRRFYAPGLPKPFEEQFAPELPPILSVSTVSESAATLYTAVPNPLCAAAVRVYLEKMKKK